MFAEYSCHKCGAVGESYFSISGKHIKQSCGSCGAYVKFYPQNELPTLKEVRAAIWQSMEQDEAAISQLKRDVNFINFPDDPHRWQQYWKIWHRICGVTK